MPENRYFVDHDFIKGQMVTLPQEELKHLRVLRKRKGDGIELVNGRLCLAKATLITSDCAKVDAVYVQSPPKRKIILALSLLRQKNLDWVIEKGTELGTTSFWLFPAEKSAKRSLSTTQQKRLGHLAICALKQCGRLDLPSFEFLPPIQKWGPLPHPLFFGALKAPPLLPLTESVILAIGPESGWTLEEHTTLLNLGGNPISLGSYTLRAETAAICAICKTL